MRADRQLVGLPRRFAAILYDGFLLVALWGFATAPLVVFADAAVTPGNHWYQAYLLVLGLAFFAWFWTNGGQTLGMRAWRIRVETTEGADLDWPAALLRGATAVISWGVFGLGFIWAIFNPNSLTWHDLLSKSRLVRTD